MSSVPDHRADGSGTESFSAHDVVARLLDAGPLIALVVQHAGGPQIVALQPGAPLILGRAPAHGLRIEHTTLRGRAMCASYATSSSAPWWSPEAR